MFDRLFCMAIALMVSIIAGSIKDAAIVFAVAAIVTISLWLLIDRFVVKGHDTYEHL
jgi:predicted PurR-regulated permease PerM